MKAAQRDKALELRIEKQLGYRTIAKQLSVSKSTLSRWLKDVPLSEKRILQLRREGWSRGEASRERFRNTMRAKRQKREQEIYNEQLKKFKIITQQSVFVAGLMLYLAEGDKKDPYHIGLANTDPEVIEFFLWWLYKFSNVNKEDVKLQLHLYSSMNIEREQKFWMGVTNLSHKHFYKHQIRPLRPSSFSYRESFRHGTCKIYVYGFKKTAELMLSIKAFLATYDRRFKSEKRKIVRA